MARNSNSKREALALRLAGGSSVRGLATAPSSRRSTTCKWRTPTSSEQQRVTWRAAGKAAHRRRRKRRSQWWKGLVSLRQHHQPEKKKARAITGLHLLSSLVNWIDCPP